MRYLARMSSGCAWCSSAFGADSPRRQSLRRTEDSAVSSTTRSNFSSLTGSVTGIRFQRPQRPPGWHSSRLGALSRLQESVKTYFKKTSKCSSRRNTRTTSVSPRKHSWNCSEYTSIRWAVWRRRMSVCSTSIFTSDCGRPVCWVQILSMPCERQACNCRPMIEPLMIFAHRKGMVKALREDMLMHLAEAAGAPATGPTPAQLRLAIVFTDLWSFTPMTQSMGDAAAAQVIERFSELVREAADRWEGRVVERIGDAFMTVFPESQSAVGCALDIERRSAEQPQFPAVRSGVHWGEVLYREGGYVGSTVNIAARLATEAVRH